MIGSYDDHQINAPLLACMACGDQWYGTVPTLPWLCASCRPAEHYPPIPFLPAPKPFTRAQAIADAKACAARYGPMPQAAFRELIRLWEQEHATLNSAQESGPAYAPDNESDCTTP